MTLSRRFRSLRSLLPLLGVFFLLGWVFQLGERSGNDFQNQLHAAHRAFADGRYAEAAAGFERSLRLQPNSPHGYHGLAISLLEMGRSEEALRAFDAAIQGFRSEGKGEGSTLSPMPLAATLANRGLLHDRQGRHLQALADYRRALELDPSVDRGPDWVTRFFRNQASRPPGIAERAAYLEDQLALPEMERQLLLPEKEGRQKPYKL